MIIARVVLSEEVQRLSDIAFEAITSWAEGDIRGDYPPLVAQLEDKADAALRDLRFAIYREIERVRGAELRTPQEIET